MSFLQDMLLHHIHSYSAETELLTHTQPSITCETLQTQTGRAAGIHQALCVHTAGMRVTLILV